MTEITPSLVGTTRGHEGQGPTQVTAFTMTSGELTATVWNYGATLVTVHAPDRNGDVVDVVCARGTLAEYDDVDDRSGYQGAIVGRFANRIARGRFDLDGVAYRLACNDGANHLHGGRIGFDQYVWDADHAVDGDEASVTLRHHSPDGDEGYPGALDVTVVYRLASESLTIEYSATTDAATIVNLTNHAYWNLAGGGRIDDHVFGTTARHYLPVDSGSIPLGPIDPVAGTRYDFTTPSAFGDLVSSGGIDHCLVFDDGADERTAVVIDPASGRRMTVETDQPGIQVYTANKLDPPHVAVCLETQRLPDAPNQPAFGPTVLRPGDTYRHTTRHVFDIV